MKEKSSNPDSSDPDLPNIDLSDPNLTDPDLLEPDCPVYVTPYGLPFPLPVLPDSVLPDSALFNNSALSIKIAAFTLTDSSPYRVERYDTLFWISGNEIEWYNGATGEWKLKENTPGAPATYRGQSVAKNGLIIFLDDKELLSFDYIIFDPLLPLYSIFPTISLNRCNECEIQYACHYISMSYPDWINCDEFEYEFCEEREERWKAIEPGWNKFIEQLKKEGRYRK